MAILFAYYLSPCRREMWSEDGRECDVHGLDHPNSLSDFSLSSSPHDDSAPPPSTLRTQMLRCIFSLPCCPVSGSPGRPCAIPNGKRRDDILELPPCRGFKQWGLRGQWIVSLRAVLCAQELTTGCRSGVKTRYCGDSAKPSFVYWYVAIP
jgi:hypothetical protein